MRVIELRTLVAGVIASLVVEGFAVGAGPDGPGEIPAEFARMLTVACRQVVLVKADGEFTSSGRLWLLERVDSSKAWSQVAGPFPIDLGRNGMAWGMGEPGPRKPAGLRLKREGDGCSPEGIFRVPFAFGYKSSASGVGLKYLQITETTAGVDDPNSHYYNQLVDSGKVKRDWRSAETMLRKDGIYRWGVFVAYNPRNVPGRGSCIFMHIWYGPSRGTSGCTAMAEANLLRILQWLDSRKEPRLVQIAKR